MSQMRILTAIGTLVLVLALAGCEDNQMRRQLGLLHQGPDPFSALPTRPIEFPDTNELPVPDSAAPSPIEPDPIRTAREVLDTAPPGTGAAEQHRAAAACGAGRAGCGSRNSRSGRQRTGGRQARRYPPRRHTSRAPDFRHRRAAAAPRARDRSSGRAGATAQRRNHQLPRGGGTRGRRLLSAGLPQ